MKKSFYETGKAWTGRLMIAAMAAGMLAACSDDDDKPESKTDLPSFTDIVTNVPETHKVSGTANDTWTASSNATGWCTVAPLTGPAGSFELEIEVDDTDWGFAKDDVATITFAYSNLGTNTTFTVTRHAREMVSQFSQDGEPVSTVVIPDAGSNFSTSLTVVNNYDWVLTSYPAWLNADPLRNASGKAGETAVLSLVVDLDNVDTEGLTGELVFSLDDNSVEKSNKIAVQVGDVVDFIYLDMEGGYTAFMGAAADGTLAVDQTFGVVSSDDYGFVALAYDPLMYWQDATYTGDLATWLDAEEVPSLGRAALDRATYKATAEANDGDERAATLLCLPRTMLDGLDGADLLDDENFIREEYRKYVVVMVSQASNRPVVYVESNVPDTFVSFRHVGETQGLTDAQLVMYYGTVNVYEFEVNNIPSDNTNAFYAFSLTDYPTPDGMGGEEAWFQATMENSGIVLVNRRYSTSVGEPMQINIVPNYNSGTFARETMIEITYYSENMRTGEFKSELAAVIFYKQNPDQ